MTAALVICLLAAAPGSKPAVPPAPLALAGISAAAAVTAVYLGASAKAWNDLARHSDFFSDALDHRQRAESFALAANVSYAIAAGALVIAVIVFFLTR
jgi:hypothetical protein